MRSSAAGRRAPEPPRRGAPIVTAAAAIAPVAAATSAVVAPASATTPFHDSGDPRMLTIDDISSAFGRRRRRPPESTPPFTPEWRNASVAMALAGEGEGLEVCFILRTERDGDPWSGQVALPGGRAEPGDPDAAAVAERETFEEIGLRLTRGQCLGPLPVQPLYRIGPRGSLSPFVYHLGPDFTRGGATGWRATLNHEVSEAFWVPLGHLFDPRAATRIEWPRPGRPETLHAGIEFEGRVIWGLTLRVLATFADLVGKRLAALDS